MRITPLDIRKQEFKKVMRGLDADEVYAFLNTVAEEYEAVLSDNKNLRERLVAIEERLNEFKSIETNLRNTLLTAEKLTQEAKESARREASLIVRQAEMEAEKASEGIRAHTSQLRREILELKKNKDNYLARLKTLIESHARMIDGYAEDFAGVDNAIEKIGRQVEEDASRPPAPPRMSRDKITQDFGHEPKDKVTWGDEPRPEEEQRPQMPRPGIERNDQPSQRTKPPENANIFAAPRTAPMAAPAPAPEVTAAAPERPAPSAAAEQPQVSRDDWRGYEVRKEAVDWKSYVIPEGAAARRAAPVDAELDNALSSLKEAAAGVEDVAPPRPEPRQAPSQAAPQAPPQAAPQAPPQAAQQNAPQAPRPRPEPVSAEAASEQSWSMDELRRNLTNLSKDEGHKG